jgi:nucleoside-diphosphate-sugar epimerase
MRLVLISGASGFLGEALASELLSLGFAVRALVRSPQKAERLSRSGAEIVVRDIRDLAIHGDIAGVDTVIHCAAAVGPPGLPRETFHSINVEGTRNLVEAFKNSRDLQRFVHVSTVAVVGATNPQNPAGEEAHCQPLDAYGETKLQAEQIVLAAVRTGLPAVIARPMWIYGSRSTVTANLFRKIALRKLPIVGPAKNTMQPVAVDDAVAGVLKCASISGIEGRVYNIAGAEILTIRSMCETIAEAVGTTLPRLYIPISAALLLATVSESLLPVLGVTPPLTHKKLDFFRVNNSYSIDRARRDLDWDPQITFREGAHKIAVDLKLASANVSPAGMPTTGVKANER